jgi:hypothetical protein
LNLWKTVLLLAAVVFVDVGCARHGRYSARVEREEAEELEEVEGAAAEAEVNVGPGFERRQAPRYVEGAEAGLPYCNSSIDCGAGQFCKDRGDGFSVCMGQRMGGGGRAFWSDRPAKAQKRE